MEVQEAASIVEEIAAEDANIIWWMSLDEQYNDSVKVTIVATGFPEWTQSEIISCNSKKKSSTTSNKTLTSWITNPSSESKPTKWTDFVTKVLWTVQNESSKKKNDSVLDIPAFLRKKK
jgi:cell division protein FtsZ